jgi:hypothetical protein
MELTYKSWYPTFLDHILVSMIMLVVEVDSVIVLMFLEVSKDCMWCRVVYVFGAKYYEDQDLRGIVSWDDKVITC